MRFQTPLTIQKSTIDPQTTEDIRMVERLDLFATVDTQHSKILHSKMLSCTYYEFM